MTDPIVAFLNARLADDQRIAEAATEGPWRVDDEQFAESVNAADGVSVVAGGRWGGEAPVFETTEDAIHIARHDPRRVLADVEAKRAIIDRLKDDAAIAGTPRAQGATDAEWHLITAARDTLRALASVYRDHPDFDPSWAS